MANRLYNVAQSGPGTSGLLQIVLIETDQLGVFNLSFQEASLESATYPSLAASIAAGTSKIAGSGNLAVVETAAATETLTAQDSGRVTICTRTSATQVFTLPVVALGLLYTFVTTSAAGEVLVNPGNASDVFAIKVTSDQGASIVTAAGIGIKNTAATNVVGDLITVIGGTGKWIMLAQSGIWASQ